MSKGAVVGIVIIGIGIIGGGGYYYASNKANEELHKTISLIEKSIPGYSLKYESSSVSPFSKSATLHKVVFKDDKGHEYTADTLVASGVSQDKLGDVSLDKFHTAIDDGTIDINHIDIKNAVAAKDAVIIEDGKIKNFFPSKVSFDLLNLQGIKAVGPNGRETITVSQYELKNYGLDRKSDQNLKQFELKSSYSEGDSEDLKVNQMQIDGLDFAKIVATVEQGKTPQVLLPGQPKKGTLEGLEFNSKGQGWSLAKIETENAIDQNGDQKSSATFSGLKIDTAHNPQLFALKEMGYSQLDGFGKISASYSKAKQQWSFTPIEMTIKDMGNLNADLQFNGPAAISNTNPQSVMTDYKLISLKVILQNQGLLQKVIDQEAKKQSVSADKVKENMINELKQDEANATIPVQKQADEAVIDLINNPNKPLVVTMNPTAPVSGMELVGISPLSIMEKLNLTVKTEAGK
ncbi:hypothetical protein [Commensalibacter nepenthis]|uniref:DUF945 domain-containing protein n=1 Tax=Commensalibacter nepenthis TaxID=3043872 RepID=A0ABT6Q4Y5_9PROT|nr:hypothetical protein [Commensalibacter sp. TBRC 10068]MDI2111955.1 hypothetical protein [Commensalibacter sp. TBRC 10068]